MPLAQALQRCAEKSRQWLDISAHEAQATALAAGGFVCLLAAYFLLLPLRDESGILLGTTLLPKLFVASVLVNTCAQPIASRLISRKGVSKPIALCQFYRSVACVVLLFALLFSALHARPRHVPPSNSPPHPAAPGHAPPTARSLLHAGAATRSASAALPAPPRADVHVFSDEPEDHHHFTIRGGDSSVQGLRLALFVAFYLWMSVQNLIATSVLWARCAEVFPSASATRIFGVLGAGATFGQLLGSASVQVLCRNRTQQLPLGIQLACLLLSALLLWVVSVLVRNLEAVQMPKRPREAKEAVKEVPLPIVRSARPPLKRSNSLSLPKSSSGHANGILSPKKASAPRHAPVDPLRRFQSSDLTAVLSGFPSGPLSRSTSQHVDLNQALARQGRGWGDAAPVQELIRWQRLLVEAFSLILASPLLLHLCAHLVCSSIVSSLLYFERTFVLAHSVVGSSSRIQWLATLNTYSAGLILVLQLFATGRALKQWGAAVALASVPTVCMAGTAMLAWDPSPRRMLVAELLRKVANYSFARPAREMLFTQVSADVKYKSKLVLDTVIQRCGDAIGAITFAVLDGQSISAAGLAAVCVIQSVLWTVIAYTLGLRHDRASKRLPPLPHVHV